MNAEDFSQIKSICSGLMNQYAGPLSKMKLAPNYKYTPDPHLHFCKGVDPDESVEKDGEKTREQLT